MPLRVRGAATAFAEATREATNGTHNVGGVRRSAGWLLSLERSSAISVASCRKRSETRRETTRTRKRRDLGRDGHDHVRERVEVELAPAHPPGRLRDLSQRPFSHGGEDALVVDIIGDDDVEWRVLGQQRKSGVPGEPIFRRFDVPFALRLRTRVHAERQ